VRERILNEIRRLTQTNGRPPGRHVFERETGIRPSVWFGNYWARWSDAITEAGLVQNVKQAKLEQAFVFEKLANACRHYGRVPTYAELRMYRKVDGEFPAHSTFTNHFPTKEQLIARFAEWIDTNGNFPDVSAMLANRTTAPSAKTSRAAAEGFVYLIRSGVYYKIGRSDTLERRVKEIRTALPEAATLVHAIHTDDPPGIEAYWHRRFSDRRTRPDAEWFQLTSSDVTAFKRRRYQ